MTRRPPKSTLFPYTTPSRSRLHRQLVDVGGHLALRAAERRPVERDAGARGQALEREAAGRPGRPRHAKRGAVPRDRKSTRLNSSHLVISYAVFCLKKKNECSRLLNASTLKSRIVFAIPRMLTSIRAAHADHSTLDPYTHRLAHYL